jgi:hypothetical protein
VGVRRVRGDSGAASARSRNVLVNGQALAGRHAQVRAVAGGPDVEVDVGEKADRGQRGSRQVSVTIVIGCPGRDVPGAEAGGEPVQILSHVIGVGRQAGRRDRTGPTSRPRRTTGRRPDRQPGRTLGPRGQETPASTSDKVEAALESRGWGSERSIILSNGRGGGVRTTPSSCRRRRNGVFEVFRAVWSRRERRSAVGEGSGAATVKTGSDPGVHKSHATLSPQSLRPLLRSASSSR